MDDLEEKLGQLGQNAQAYQDSLHRYQEIDQENERVTTELQRLQAEHSRLASELSTQRSAQNELRQAQDELVTGLVDQLVDYSQQLRNYETSPFPPAQQKILQDPVFAKRDRKRIVLYEQTATEDPDVARVMEPLYQEARTREEQRRQLQAIIDHPPQTAIMVRPGQEMIELYLSVPYDRQTEGLGAYLTRAVMDSLILERLTVQKERNEKGIVLLEIVPPEPEKLVSRLRLCEPEEFKERRIEYRVITVPDLERITVSEKGLTEPVEHGPSLDAPEHPPEPHQPSRDNDYLKRLQTITVESRAYVRIQDSQALTGLHCTNLYKSMDTKGGPLRTTLAPAKTKRKERWVELESLVQFIEQHWGKPVHLYEQVEAAQIWRERAEKELGRTDRDVESYRKHIAGSISRGELAGIKGTDHRSYFCEQELENFLRNYFARQKAKTWTEPTIPRDIVAEWLYIPMQQIGVLSRQEDLQLMEDQQTVIRSSVNRFLKAKRYFNGRWVPRVVPRKGSALEEAEA